MADFPWEGASGIGEATPGVSVRRGSVELGAEGGAETVGSASAVGLGFAEAGDCQGGESLGAASEKTR
ncbi:MAG: hypothetical protein JKY65_29445 [Planctomycetes bacterium]|nr:hypothetical protein [Planctomycetota bacterium]